MSFVFYDSRSTQFKKPFGALRTGEQAEFRVHLPKGGAYRAPRLLLYQADQWDQPQTVAMSFVKAEPNYNVYACKLSLPAPQLCFYCFELELLGGGVKKLTRTEDGEAELADAASNLWQLTVYAAELETPDFLKGGVMYQIFPDRFCNSGEAHDGVPGDRKLHENWYEMPDYLPNAQGEITNSDYFCGDLKGVAHKLDYLHGLGVTCIYLNPIFEAHSNHRYNTADYNKVDPLLGAEDDLRALCEQARALGIRVILDGVFSHTGDDSVYFNRRGRYPGEGAYNSQQSRYYPWYDFQHWPDQYSSWWGFDTLPNVNELHPDYIEFICGEQGVLRHWLELGVSGFRLDVADELPDGFLDALTASVKGYDPDALVLGEVWEDASNKIAYGVRRRYFLGRQLDSVMNYPFKDAVLSFVRYGGGAELCRAVMTILENYPKPVVDVLMNCLSTHDVERAITKLAGPPMDGRDRQWQCDHHFLSEADYRNGRALFQLAEVLQFFLPGVPSVYYGDEVGMTGYRDPFNRCTYPWESGDRDLLAFTRELSALRGEHRGLLSDAPFLAVDYSADCFAFTRMKDSEGLLIAVNRGDQPYALDLPFDPEPLLGSWADGVLPARSFLIGKV